LAYPALVPRKSKFGGRGDYCQQSWDCDDEGRTTDGHAVVSTTEDILNKRMVQLPQSAWTMAGIRWTICTGASNMMKRKGKEIGSPHFMASN
jgi:hypothetical protein